jgi:hypothetical protein
MTELSRQLDGTVAAVRPLVGGARFVLVHRSEPPSAVLALPPEQAHLLSLGDTVLGEALHLGGPAIQLSGTAPLLVARLRVWDVLAWLSVGRVLLSTVSNPTRAAPLWHSASKHLADAVERAAAALSSLPKAPLVVGKNMTMPTVDAMTLLAGRAMAASKSVPDALASWQAMQDERGFRDEHLADAVAKLAPMPDVAAAVEGALDAEMLRTDMRGAAIRLADKMRAAATGTLDSIAAPAMAMGLEEPRQVLVGGARPPVGAAHLGQR